jgi:hypothetical protein
MDLRRLNSLRSGYLKLLGVQGVSGGMMMRGQMTLVVGDQTFRRVVAGLGHALIVRLNGLAWLALAFRS